MSDTHAPALAAMVRARQRSAVEVCEAALERIAAADAELNAFLAVDRDRALASAAAVDAHPEREQLPLAGVPIGIKDNLCTRHFDTTAGSRILEGYRPPYDATAIERLEAAGAVIVGKTNCDEFAMGSSTENSAFGPTRNPWALDRTPGGSSGGSAAAVAAELVPLALGSDTGGSVRQPAGFCGIIGFKPTYGRVSRYGLLAFASSLDQIGPLASNVAGAALCFRVIAGHDPRDATSLRHAALTAGSSSLAGLRIGVPRRLVADAGVDAGVSDAFARAVAAIEQAGARITEVELPRAAYGVAVYYVLACAEASANLARYDGVRYGRRAEGAATLDDMYTRTRSERFGLEVKRRIVLGTYVLSAGYYDAYYRQAQQVRTLLAADCDAAFAQVDLVACPTSPAPAYPLGERLADPLRVYLADVFTVTANLAGLPAISLPCGLSAEGLPIGFQLMGARGADEIVLSAAEQIEALLPPVGRPPLARGAV